MNIDQLRKQFPDEAACRHYFESIIWSQGRRCPHCGSSKSCRLNGVSVKAGTYECYRCKRQFRVTTKTPMHSTKLPFWTWLQAIYYILCSSKGVSSVILAKWLGVSQPTAWRIGHAIRQMMTPCAERPKLGGIVEVDEKYFGGKPRYQAGITHKRGRGTSKQLVLIAVQRQGSVRSQPVENDKIATLVPIVQKFVDQIAHIMSDQHYSYRHVAVGYAAHSTVKHLRKEYVRDDVHINSTESFSSMLERVKWGVFHYMSRKHLSRYLTEIEFRWNHCTSEQKITKNGKKKNYRKPFPFFDLLNDLLDLSVGKQIRRTKNNGIVCFENVNFAN